MYDYQEQACQFVLNTPYCGVFFDMGLGKTLISLQATLRRNPHGNVLVVAPKTIARNTWIDDIRKFDVPLRYKSLIVNENFKDVSKKRRLELYQEAYTSDKPAVYFINRELLTDLVANMPMHNGRPVWFFPNLILDESQSFKSHSSQRFKAIKRVRPACSTVIELSGTPTPQGLMDLWSQIYILDGGARLGPTITWYRKTFFRETMHMNGYPVKWEPLPGAEEEIHRRVSDITISAKNTLNLPPVTYNIFKCYMNDKEKAQYTAMAKDKVLEVLNNDKTTPIKAVNAGVLHIKLSQLASGTLYMDDDKRYAIIHDRKLEALEQIMSRSSGPILIAYYFQSDKQEILKRIPGAVVFDGSKQMQQDWNDRKIPIMLLHPGSSGHGINIQYGGHTLIWYTMAANLEQYLQTNARLCRNGQTEPVIIHHILCEGTVDTRTLRLLGNKNETENRFMDAIRMTGSPDTTHAIQYQTDVFDDSDSDSKDAFDLTKATNGLIQEMQDFVHELLD